MDRYLFEWFDASFPSKRDTLHTPSNPNVTRKNNTDNRIEYYRSLISDAIAEMTLLNEMYSGLLELKGIPKSMRHYSVKLR